MSSELQETWATLGVRLYACKDLMSIIEASYADPPISEKLQEQMRLLHCGLDLANRAMESDVIKEIIGETDIPF